VVVGATGQGRSKTPNIHVRDEPRRTFEQFERGNWPGDARQPAMDCGLGWRECATTGHGTIVPNQVESPMTKPINITIGPDLQCPTCGATELANPDAPVADWLWQIRPNKVYHYGNWWSQCLICSGNNPDKGWFAS